MSKDKTSDTIATIIIVAIIIVYVIWTYVLSPFVGWIQKNILWVGGFILALIVIAIVIIYYMSKEEAKKEALNKIERERVKLEKEKEKALIDAEKKAFVESQREKGLVSFIDHHGVEKWGMPKEVKKWSADDKDAAIKESKLYQVSESIKNFQPSRVYKDEFGYHIELQGWLKHEFPTANIEKRTGASRPDISIDEIAIEVKGPTGNKELGTLPEKCLKYTGHYDNLIIVLFEPSFTEKRYNEIKQGIEKYFPNVQIIKKD